MITTGDAARHCRTALLAVTGVLVVAAAPSHVQAQAPDTTVAVNITAPVSNWTSDRRRFAVGDIITVLVDEHTIASADRSNTSVQDRNTQGTLAAGGGVRGSTAAGADAAVRTGMSADSRERGQARRSDRMSTEISVRVVAVEAGGVLRVEGTKELLIDKQQQLLRVAGLVRPNDITARNVVESWRLADASISYASKGDLGKPRRSIFGRIIGILWP